MAAKPRIMAPLVRIMAKAKMVFDENYVKPQFVSEASHRREAIAKPLS